MYGTKLAVLDKDRAKATCFVIKKNGIREKMKASSDSYYSTILTEVHIIEELSQKVGQICNTCMFARILYFFSRLKE